MIQTKIVFDWRKRAVKGIGSIDIRLTVMRKVVYLSTGEKCHISQFRNGEIRNTTDNAIERNRRIRIIRDKIEQIANDMMERGEPIDGKAIRQRLNDSVRHADESSMLDWFSEQIEELAVCECTKKHYRLLIRTLQDWGRMHTWADLTTGNIFKLDSYLHSIESANGRLSDATVWNYHKNLKHLINRAVIFEIIERNPYDALRGRLKRGTKESVEYLTEDEMNAVMSVQCDGMLAKARDLFIFQMFTGLSYSDTQKFDIKSYKFVDGRWICNDKRVKTGVAYTLELLQPAVDVLSRNNWRLPRLCNADYNRALKLIGAAAHIQCNLHSHLARHTFATWMLSHGAKIENVSRMLGHTSITNTQRYAKVVADSVLADFDKMKERLTPPAEGCSHRRRLCP